MSGDVIVTGVGLTLESGASAVDLLDELLGREVARSTDQGESSAGSDAPIGYRAQDTSTALALRSAADAVAHVPAHADGAEIGVIVASITSNLDSIVRIARGIAADSYRAVHPTDVLSIAGTQVTAALSAWFDARAFAYSSCTGAAAGLDAVALAAMSLRCGRAERVLVVGTEVVLESAAPLIAVGDGSDATFSGGVSLVLERAWDGTHPIAPGPGADARSRVAVVGAMRHGETIEDVFDDSSSPPVGIVFLPAGTTAERSDAAAAARERYPGADVVDLTTALGECSGALGVLQCALAWAWLARHPARSALAVSGSLTDHHLVSTILTTGRTS